MSVIIRLQNLPLAANASDVRSFFKGLSIPDGGVHIVGGALGDAFIAFSTDEDARQAMALNGGCIKNEPISLLLSSRAEMQKVIEQARKAALSYMQLKQAATTVATAVLPKAAVPQPSIIPTAVTVPAQTGQKLTAVAKSLTQFNIPPPGNSKLAASVTTAASTAAVQQPQPPVISLAGFLAKAAAKQQNKASVTPATTLSPLLAQGSSYNEIPGLSFLSSDAGDVGTTTPTASAVPPIPSNSSLSDWLSALHGQAAKVAPVVAEMPRPIIVEDQSPWKFLKKDRRSHSRSRSRERSYRRSSRSSSRERENRSRRSRSSSRDRTAYKRDGGHSRSSSRDRNTRWSRSSSREYGRGRYRNSRSRSSSRDRFGRTRQRSRSRSRDRRSQESNSRDRYDASNNSGRSARVSRFSERNELDFAAQQQQAMHSMNGLLSGIHQAAEPIFGLHTTPGAIADLRSRYEHNQPPGHFSTRSGKISPPPNANGGFGSSFRNTSPLPDSVYASTKSGANTSDYAVKMSNLEPAIGYGEIRRCFKTHLISTQGIKMINDRSGRRTGVAYIQFLRKEGKKFALTCDGSVVRRRRVRIESITDQEYEAAIDSYRPGVSPNSRPWDDSEHNVNPWSTNDSATESRNGGRGRAGSNDVIEIPDDRDEPRNEHRRPPSVPSAALVVWNLPTFTTEQDIMKMFSDFTVVEVLIVRNHHVPKQLDGYVKFHRQEDAQEAWKQVHRHFIGIKKVTVRVCQEIDYEVAKNEHENPREVEESTSEQQNSDEQRKSERERSGNHETAANGNVSDSGGSNGRQGRSNKHGTRWGSVERTWNNSSDNVSPTNSMMEARRQMDFDAGANSDTNGSWNNRDERVSRGDDSVGNDSDNNGNASGNQNMNNMNRLHIANIMNSIRNMNGNGNSDQQQQQQHQQGGNSRDPRRANSRFGANTDNSEMFQRTNWLLLRNVDFHVYEEDVFAFFGHDGFQAKNVLLVHNERGGRTGECLVEFGSPSEAAHAESKSSQNLGRRKVFASHLDRGQVADLMARFNAIAQGLQPSHWLPDHLRNNRTSNNGGSNGGNGDGSQADDPEKNQGVGCGPYRTSTVGLLNLAYKTSVEDIHNFFQEFDLPLENIRKRFLDNGHATGEAMVRFRNHQDAEKALNEYQNRKLFGRNVRIRLINDD
uniref:RRM domain-containing protein n=1 Tax=Anopheles christyi TaxID=43041 RepID=A0A182KBY4_9DIPT